MIPIRANRSWRKRLILTLAQICLMLLVFAASIAFPSPIWNVARGLADCPHPSGCLTDIADSKADTYRPGFTKGNMNGVKLRVPNRYLVGPVGYVDPQISNLQENARNDTKQPAIAYFSLLLRLSNFKPIESSADENDWIAATSTGRPAFDSAWLIVDVDNRSSAVRNTNANFPKWLKEDPVHRGPFVRDSASRHGLVHYESTQSVDASPLNSHYEYFYDADSDTNIVCNTKRSKMPPFDTFDSCQHRFFDAEINVMLVMSYKKNDLPRWKLIEKSVRQTIHSFIIVKEK
jgi:hypothetical protein